MRKNSAYNKEILKIALPVTAQCIFQSSLSFVDQFMVGRLGENELAASGLGGKFSSLYGVTLAAMAATASILISQFAGSKDKEGVSKSFCLTSYISIVLMLLFTIPSILCPEQIMKIYLKKEDYATCILAANYLRIVAYGFLAYGGTMMLSAFLRSVGETKYPLYASVVSITLNIIGNYILIFGKFGAPKLGIEGAALATTIARYVEFLILLVIFIRWNIKNQVMTKLVLRFESKFFIKVCVITAPILLNEFLWSLGENIYAVIYGKMSSDDLGAMTLTYSIQGLFISGLFAGVSTAAGVMIGNRLGKGDQDDAYDLSKYLLKMGFFGSIAMGAVLIAISRFYVRLFNVSSDVRQTAVYILYAFGILLFSKVCNMILGSGILRAGGETKYNLMIDLIGTWCVGIPVGFLTAFVFHLPIYVVYFCLTLEECVRLAIGLYIFRSRKWMKNVTLHEGEAKQAS